MIHYNNLFKSALALTSRLVFHEKPEGNEIQEANKENEAKQKQKEDFVAMQLQIAEIQNGGKLKPKEAKRVRKEAAREWDNQRGMDQTKAAMNKAEQYRQKQAEEAELMEFMEKTGLIHDEDFKDIEEMLPDPNSPALTTEQRRAARALQDKKDEIKVLKAEIMDPNLDPKIQKAKLSQINKLMREMDKFMKKMRLSKKNRQLLVREF